MPTPLRNVRVPDHVWLPAKARTRADGITLASVIVGALAEYARSGTRTDGGEPASPSVPHMHDRGGQADGSDEQGPCMHPAGLIRDDSTCGACGTDVW